MRRIALSVALSGLLATQAVAWTEAGHKKIARLAVVCLPATMPAFFRQGAAAIVSATGDPDLFSQDSKLVAPALYAAEGPEHYFDLEPLDGLAPPATRYEFLDQLAAKKLAPRAVGLAPYAIMEWTGRLTLALADYRRDPTDRAIQDKCLVYAAILAHYAADINMPLHTTIHHDGRAEPGKPSPKTGIHLKVDALPGKLAGPGELPADARLAAFDDLHQAVFRQIDASHALVERVYELEKDLPGVDDPLPGDSPLARFTAERVETSAVFVADLFLTAWQDSAKVKFPPWHGEAVTATMPAPMAAHAAAPANRPPHPANPTVTLVTEAVIGGAMLILAGAAICTLLRRQKGQ
jgi:hypothetical protein